MNWNVIRISEVCKLVRILSKKGTGMCLVGAYITKDMNWNVFGITLKDPEYCFPQTYGI